MFVFKNGKFHTEGLSFTIPDGYTLDVFDASESYQGSMKMVSPDGKIVLAVKGIFCSEGSIGIELDAAGHFRDKLVNHADTFQTVIPAAPIKRKHLYGYCGAYQTSAHKFCPSLQHYEELYEISHIPNELNFIEISITTETEYTIQKALNDPQMVRFFAELDAE